MKTKEQLLKVATELEETWKRYNDIEYKMFHAKCDVNSTQHVLLKEYCDAYREFTPYEDYIKTETGISHRILSSKAHYYTASKDENSPMIEIMYEAEHGSSELRFSEHEAKENILRGKWELVKEEDVIKTPKSITLTELRHVKDKEFIGTNNKFIVLFSCNNKYNVLRKMNDPVYAECRWFLKENTNVYAQRNKYSLYFFEKGGKALKANKEAQADLIKVSQDKEDFLDELI